MGLFSCFANIWHSLCSGWVVEYPGQNGEPNDFFTHKDRPRQWVKTDQRNANP